MVSTDLVDKILLFFLQAQIVVLGAQISWSERVEAALQTISNQGGKDLGPLEKELRVVEATLNVLADCVLQEQPPVRRRKLEHLVGINVFQWKLY